MPDLTITSAATLTGSTIAEDDLLPVLDVSAAIGSKGSSISVAELSTRILTGGALSALTGLSLRSTGSAHDLKLATSEVFTAGRMLSFILGDADRTLMIPATGTAALLEAAQSFISANIFSANGSAYSPALSVTGSLFTGGSSTTTKPLFLIEPTGTTSTGWSTSGTLIGANSPSNFSGKVLDAQIDSKSVFSVDKNGVLIGMPGIPDYNVTLWSNWGALSLNNTVITAFNGDIRYSAINSNGTIQYFALCHDSMADVLALRNRSNAQALRIYETYTDASNYSRLSFIASASDYSIKPESAGTGTQRDLSLGAIGSSVSIQGSRLQFGGTTSSYPALATESGVLQVLLADGSGYAPLDAEGYSVGGTPGVSGSATGANTLTIVNGIITNIS